MLSFLSNRTYPVGVDIADDALKLAQLAGNGNGLSLIEWRSEDRPENIKPGSVNWQKWAIETIKKLTANGNFRGREATAAMPAGEMFIDHVRMPKTNNSKPEEAIISKIKHKLPFDPADAMIRHIPAENDNMIVIGVEKERVSRHLAIYEKANLCIKSIGIWPVALTNSYVQFFGRRKSDLETIVMLLDIETNCTNVVVCRHKSPLFARSIPIGLNHLENDETIKRLVLELNGCRRYFGSMYRKAEIERLIFLSGQSVDKDICAKIAKWSEMPAQVGDCIAAVTIDAGQDGQSIDRRGCQVNWAIAFGLSLTL